ncbi:MAG TPA: helix-turn-helix domain-containing protein [Gammaproteobacteria bacterium]|nr:helix-turn-helix domain-containing protein [Gammaproteobacteria bacterium]
MMTSVSVDTVQAGTLEVLGVGEAEERVYRRLLSFPRSKASDIAHALSLPTTTAQRLLEAIESKGLATHTPERPRRYIASAPDIALEPLALRHQEDLQRVRHTIKELRTQAVVRQRTGSSEQVVEVVNSREAGRQIYDQLHRTSQSEICSLVKAPILISRLDIAPGIDGQVQREARMRGTNYRSIVDFSFLSLPGATQRIHEDIRAGEQYRVHSELPIKVTLVDRRIGFIPLKPKSEGFYSLLMRTSPLLDGLYALFESLWEGSCPISFASSGSLEIEGDNAGSPERLDDLLELMAAGLNDKRIAFELGISASTLKRRIAALMKAYNVRTRFQLGRVTNRGSQ